MDVPSALCINGVEPMKRKKATISGSLSSVIKISHYTRIKIFLYKENILKL